MNRKLLLVVVIGFGLIASVVRADVKLPRVFGESMVLQRGIAVPVWGTAAAGEKVVVTLAGQTKSTQADGGGKWMLKLDPIDSGGPFEMTITGADGKTLTLKGILVGEVWICAGQSNMELRVAFADGAQEALAHADDPQLRLYRMDKPALHQLPSNPGGAWAHADAKSVEAFSAVGYYFGSKLRKDLGGNMPVGLIDCTVGGSTAQSWTRRAALEKNPIFKQMLDESWDKWIAANDDYDAKLTRYPQEVEAAKKDGKPIPPQPTWPPVPFKWNRPGTIWEGMVRPLVPLGIRGVIWYQGEANAPRAQLYRTLFPTMIRAWRDEWSEGDFPILFVQLAHGGAPPTSQPVESIYAELREAQTMTAASVPGTGMAVSVDTPPHEIHPRDKRTIGERLARVAEAKVYGKNDVVYAGPTYAGMKVEGGKVRITFANAKGLVARDGKPPQGFAIAGEDRKWQWASAKIDGETVVVWNDEVPAPAAVRYAWSDVPTVNLYNDAGLPAVPFRTDDWEGITEKNSFVPADQL